MLEDGATGAAAANIMLSLVSALARSDSASRLDGRSEMKIEGEAKLRASSLRTGRGAKDLERPARLDRLVDQIETIELPTADAG